MYRPRVIPVLLLKNDLLYKSVKFKNHRYIGEPINTVRLYNDLGADELVFLDINATIQNRVINVDLVKQIGDEANMPFAVGGGITTLKHIEQLIKNGAEKVIINAYALSKPAFIKEASNWFGATTIVVCMDIKTNFWGVQKVYSKKKPYTEYTPVEYAKIIEDNGAGEIIIQSVDHDGCMNGYDIDLINKISKEVTIPTVALGGAGTLAHLREVYEKTPINGLAAGSLFVYQSSNKGVLINYPKQSEKTMLFS